MRAAIALRPFLSELGCLPVSALVGFASCHELFDAEGAAIDPAHRMLKQLPSMLSQLEWVAVAFLNQKAASGLPR